MKYKLNASTSTAFDFYQLTSIFLISLHQTTHNNDNIMDSPSHDTPEIDPYALLGIPATSTAAEIRSAYRKLALSTHPDKVPVAQREAAHSAFQELAFAYSVLSDDSRRKRYDETGSTKESVLDEDFDWRSFFKAQYEKVGKEAIETFRREYQGEHVSLSVFLRVGLLLVGI
jgi:DnaJ family protein C protein 9